MGTDRSIAAFMRFASACVRCPSFTAWSMRFFRAVLNAFEALGRDPELAGDVVEHRSALLLGCPQLRRRHGTAGTRDGKHECSSDCDFLDACHALIEPADSKRGVNVS